MKNKIHILLISIAFLLNACSGTKHLPPGKKLYTGAKIEFKPKQNKKTRKRLKNVAEDALRPKPNSKFLGMRPKVWMYLKGDTAKKGIKKFLRKKGEAPIYLSDVNPTEIAKYIDAKLFNAGVFNSVTEYKIIEKKKTARIVYTSSVHAPYKIAELNFEIDDRRVRDIIVASQKESLLKKGNEYSLDQLKAERERLDEELKNSGYFFFSPDYFLFKADSSAANKTVNLRLSIKKETPGKALRPFIIKEITINPDYSLEKNRDSSATSFYTNDSIQFTTQETKVKPSAIVNSVRLKRGDLYSRNAHSNTLHRLMNMGTYQFARIRFTEIDSGGNTLRMYIALTPLPKRTMRYELNLISKSNDFLGPQGSINYINRNTLNSAELLDISIGGSFETQLAGKYKNLFSYSFSSKAELIFPRFLLPFKIKNTSSYFIPKTRALIGYNYLQRVGFFDLKSLRLIYGFKWKESQLKEHELNPVNINVTTIGNQTAEFNRLLETNPFVKRSYEEQFIAGASYNYLYNEQVLPEKKEQWYINLMIESSGNLISLISRANGKIPNPNDQATLGGVPFSQFLRASIDIRNYLNFGKNKLVERIFVGAGKAYGNSATMPYIKQFFSGGPNSIRAFAINSVGPSTYSVEGGKALLFLQQGGDIKIEGNIEYRFDITKIFKGALFTDVGNTWLIKNNPAIKGNPFGFSTFAKELAVGAGIGLRLDVTFFVLRFDLATPLRIPSRPEGKRWVIDKINPASGSWRSDNLILNVAIGYPF